MKGGFALDRILFLRLRLSLKPVNKVFSIIMTAWDLGVCVIFHRLSSISLEGVSRPITGSLLRATWSIGVGPR